MAERDAEAILILTDGLTMMKDRRFYHLCKMLGQIEISGVRRLRSNMIKL